MKSTHGVILALMFPVLLAASASGDSPASWICDRSGGGSESDRARNVVNFNNALAPGDRLHTIEEADRECAESKVELVRPEVESYCAARDRLGHDLAVDELQKLKWALDKITFKCWEERSEAEQEIRERMLPTSCGELRAAFLAFAEYYRQAKEPDPQLAHCIESNVEEISRPLAEMCSAGELALHPAFFELNERMSRRCPRSE